MTETFYEQPILNSPYAEPTRHHALDEEGRPTDNPPVAALCHHHWIEDDVRGFISLKAIDDYRGDVGRMHHADFQGIDSHVGENAIDLCGNEIRRHGMDEIDAARVLRNKRRYA